MKRLGFVAALMLMGAGSAGATDIAGKWGIGAALFNTGVETSLIRGHSDRTAWVFDLAFSGSTADRTDELASAPTIKTSFSTWEVVAGPALRRFFRPSSEFSPYGDLFVSVHYRRDHSDVDVPPSSVNLTTFGVGTGLAFGLEYFTRWHCSIAADTNLLNLGWDRLTDQREQLGAEDKSTEDRFLADLRIAPRLIVRAYF